MLFSLYVFGHSPEKTKDLQSTIVFINVNVIPVDSERILERHAVIVKNGLIDTVGPVSKVQIPEDAFKIDGTGKYLMPGLADMHVHNWSENEFVLFLANGVTTIRNMWSAPQHLQWREKIEKGELLGPRIYTAGPLLDGSLPIWICPSCGGQMRIMAFIEDHNAIDRIIRHLKLTFAAERPSPRRDLSRFDGRSHP